MKMLSRHNEGVMMVTQNNELGTLTVLGVNDDLRELLGYESDIVDAPLSQFLGSSAEQLIKDDVEFEDDAMDLSEVLSKHRQIRLLKQNGIEVNLDVTIMRAMARDRHHLFRLVFSTPSLMKEKLSLTNALKESFADHEVTDKETSLPDSASMMKYVDMTQDYIKDKPIKACFVYMLFEDYKQLQSLNQKHDVNILRHVSHVVQRNLRSDDTVGRIADDALGMILVDINDDTVHLALNRIKHMVHHDPLHFADGQVHTPLIRQSCIFLDDMSVEDMKKMCLKLLEDDRRDMVVYRDHTKEIKIFP